MKDRVPALRSTYTPNLEQLEETATVLYIYIYYIYIYIYTILPKVLAPLLMKGLTTLVISMSTNLNV